MSSLRFAFALIIAACGAGGIGLVGAGVPQDPPGYLVVSPTETRTLPIARRSGTTDLVALDVLPRFFDITLREDARTDSIVLTAGTQRVALTPGQATVSAAGRLVALSAPVVKEGARWLVPIDFLRVLDPLLDRRIDIRRAARIVVLDSARVPRLTAQLDRVAGGGRLVITSEPATVARVSRTGGQVTVRFQADALDLRPLSDAPQDLLTTLKAVGPALMIDLGPAVVDVQQIAPQDPARVTLTLVVAGAQPTPRPTPTAPPPAAAPPTTPPVARTAPPPVETPLPPVAAPPTPPTTPMPEATGVIRTVVLDPGHGGQDRGSRSVSGVEEAAVTLAVAQRLRGVLEAQLGVRVILTRDFDTDVPIDRRAAIANNNKADVFISLHANGSPVAAKRGWQVQSLDADEYGGASGGRGAASTGQSVPIVGGGSRVIDVVPWQLAQMPHVRRSATLAALLAGRLAEAGLSAQTIPVMQVPARVLVGANMPAVLIELGFLTNEEEATILADRAFHGRLADVVTSVISGLRMGWPFVAGGGVR